MKLTSKPTDAAQANRRDFLKIAAFGAPATAVAAALAPAQAKADAGAKGRGYVKTEHVRAYLASCRF